MKGGCKQRLKRNPCGRSSPEGGFADGEKGVYVQTRAGWAGWMRKVQRWGSSHRYRQVICFVLCCWLYLYADEGTVEFLVDACDWPCERDIFIEQTPKVLVVIARATVPGVQVINCDWHCLREIYMNLSRDVSSWNNDYSCGKVWRENILH